MKYQVIPVTAFAQNCSLFWCERTLKAAVIDPGGDIARIVAAIEAAKVHVEKILLTHGHMDHVGGTAELKSLLGVPVIGPHREDMFWIEALDTQAEMMGFSPVQGFVPDQLLNEGAIISVGDERLEVLHCPGHTPGHVIFFCESARKAFVGDVLFRESIGRTDFPRGNHQQLIHSIRTKLWPLGDDVSFVPGHGPESTFGYERLNNPFVRGSPDR